MEKCSLKKGREIALPDGRLLVEILGLRKGGVDREKDILFLFEAKKSNCFFYDDCYKFAEKMKISAFSCLSCPRFNEKSKKFYPDKQEILGCYKLLQEIFNPNRASLPY